MSEAEERNDKGAGGDESVPTASFSGSEKGPGGQVGAYKLLRMLGEGGFAEVYLAEQQRPVKRRVALKVIKPGMDSKQVIARFEAERQALALLDHPNIAQVYDAGTTEAGRPYFVMEYVRGISLTEHCDGEKLSIEERLKLFGQVCEGVQHAHQKGIIHRDIKPSNVLVSIEGEHALPKIIDFGVAKAITQPLTERTLFTEQGQMIGTPEYMSPEQAGMTAQDIDTRSDIYSLGVLLYELLTGTLPFDRKTLQRAGFAEIQRIIREEDPPRPSTKLTDLGEEATKVAKSRRTEVATLARRLHRELEWIPLKAMRKERTHRYRSATELADDIQNYLNGSPLIAGPESVTYRAKKFVRRNRALVTGVAAVLIVLVAGIIASTIFAIKESRARAIADSARNRAVKAQEETQRANEKLRWENYVATLGVIQMRIEDGRLPRAREMLENCPVKHRGWEWGRLMRQASPELLNIRTGEFDDRPPVTMHNAVFTPDERYILDDHPTGWMKTLIDLHSGKTVLQTKGYGKWRECTQFMPEKNHVSFAFGRFAVGIVDLWSGKTLAKFDAGKAALRSFAVSSDGQIAAGCAINEKTGEREIILWNASDSRELKRFQMETLDHSDLPKNLGSYGEAFEIPKGRVLGFLSDNKCLSYADEHLSILNIETGERKHLTPCHGRIARYASESHKAVIINSSNRFEVWDLAEETKVTESKQTVQWNCLAISTDGKWVATPGGGGSWTLWQGDTGEYVRSYGDPRIGVNSIAFSSSKGCVVTTDQWEIKVWPVLAERNMEVIPFKTKDNQPTRVRLRLFGHEMVHEYDHQVRRLVTGDGGGNISIWEVPSFRLLTQWRAHFNTMILATFSPDDTLLATSSKDGTAKIWEVSSGKLLHTFKNEPHQMFKALTFSKDNKHLALGTGRISTSEWKNLKFGVMIVEIETGRTLLTTAKGEIGISVVAYSPNGKWLVVGRGDYYRPGSISIFDAETGQQSFEGVSDIWAGHASFTRDSRYVLLISKGSELALVDIEERREVWRLHNVEAHQATFHPDGRRFVTMTGSKVAVHATRDGREMITLKAGSSPATFIADGRQLIYRQDDSHMRILHSDDWTLPSKEAAFQAALRDVQQELHLTQ